MMSTSNRIYNVGTTGLLAKKELAYLESTNRNIDIINWKREDSFLHEQGKSKFIKTINHSKAKEIGQAKATRRIEDTFINNKTSHNLLYIKEDPKCHISKIKNTNEQQLMSSLTTTSHSSKKKKSISEYNTNTNTNSNNNNNSYSQRVSHNVNKMNKKLYHDQLRSNNIHNNQCRKNSSSKICKRCYIQKMQEQIEFIKERKQRTTVYVREFNDFLKYENFYEKIINREEKKNKLQSIKLNRIHRVDSLYNPNENNIIENKNIVNNTNECNIEPNPYSLDKLSEQISFKKNLFLFLNNVFKKH